MLAYRDAKTMAKAMREALAARDLTISHSEALEIVARQPTANEAAAVAWRQSEIPFPARKTTCNSKSVC
ncbi:hypothetical protein Mesau_04543 [Mesorhizobium australicum WSM2073]|uniref:Glyoxalase-related protein domain-containing protein n=1 Tax=Mesorhizobium australicum (strain HAMBI 3006 / LMG 24608 / WSM2073) TaxID=754035 RepID=L0KQC3_MESAW|nr:hypothetical protein Mesau_04543 [Mesorhizobium australicum WSM2073]